MAEEERQKFPAQKTVGTEREEGEAISFIPAFILARSEVNLLAKPSIFLKTHQDD